MSEQQAGTGPEDTPEEAGVEEQIAFDVGEFPGGARSAIEAVLMVVDEPVTEVALASALELPVDDVREHLEGLEREYAEQQRGFTLRSVAGGWRVYSRSDYAPVVEKFLLDGQQAKLTQASLETLAVIAYRQPISRSRVSAVRGVNVDGVVRTLLNRGLIEELGAEGDSGAVLYGTTDYWWVVLMVNNILDVDAQWPLNHEELENLIERKYGDARGDTHHWTDVDGNITDPRAVMLTGGFPSLRDAAEAMSLIPYDNEEYETMVNDAKRQIKLIDPTYIDTFGTQLEKVMNDG